MHKIAWPVFHDAIKNAILHERNILYPLFDRQIWQDKIKPQMLVS